MITPQILASDSEHCIATWDCVLVQLWRTATKLPAVQGLRKQATAFAAGREGLLGMIVLVEDGAAFPDTPTRAELAALWTELAPRLACVSMVQEGGGFRAATVRSIMTGLALVTRQPSPYRIFADVQDAWSWMAPQLPARGGLPLAIRQLRANL